MKKRIQIIFTAAACLSALITEAQEHAIPCAATEYENHLRSRGLVPTRDVFESWLSTAASGPHIEMDGGDNAITLPVVIHIIHDGDEVGISENIPYERIMSQLTVLNQDFGHIEGTPGNVPGNAGTDTKIRFCLAQRDPDGNPTDGIDRRDLGRASWNTMEDVDDVMKVATMWDPERYINIWVCRFGGQLAQIGGYSYFPEGSGLEGLEGAESTAAIDGIAMSFKAFGSSDIFPATTYFPQNDKGRSLTHEMGHFFGLRHIWGDESSCSATDYCDDTPPVKGVHFMCEHEDTCTTDEFEDMIENHMDYTPDACKSIFTAGQKARMWAVLQNAPRRVALSQSDACQPALSTGENAMQRFMVYPNPASERLHITAAGLTDGALYEVYDIPGTRIASGNIDSGKSIDISDMASGMYILKLTYNGKTTAIRFIKK